MIPTEMLPDEERYLGLHSRFPILPFHPSGSSVVTVVLMIHIISDHLGAHLHVQTLVERSNWSSLQVFFQMSECLHLLGMRCGGKCSTLPINPKQSEIIVNNPLNAGDISFMLCRIRCISISPSSSPRYAFSETVVSRNDPISIPVPSVHSKIKAVEQTFGYNSLM